MMSFLVIAAVVSSVFYVGLTCLERRSGTRRDRTRDHDAGDSGGDWSSTSGGWFSSYDDD